MCIHIYNRKPNFYTVRVDGRELGRKTPARSGYCIQRICIHWWRSNDRNVCKHWFNKGIQGVGKFVILMLLPCIIPEINCFCCCYIAVNMWDPTMCLSRTNWFPSHFFKSSDAVYQNILLTSGWADSNNCVCKTRTANKITIIRKAIVSDAMEK